MVAVVVVALIAGFMAFIAFIISLLPNIDSQGVINIGNDLLKYGLAFVPASCWATFLATVIAFEGFQFSWAVIEWLYKKIPGVD